MSSTTQHASKEGLRNVLTPELSAAQAEHLFSGFSQAEQPVGRELGQHLLLLNQYSTEQPIHNDRSFELQSLHPVGRELEQHLPEIGDSKY
jgi:hypothetical protein